MLFHLYLVDYMLARCCYIRNYNYEAEVEKVVDMDIYKYYYI
jgi:hypothetical protein